MSEYKFLLGVILPDLYFVSPVFEGPFPTSVSCKCHQ